MKLMKKKSFKMMIKMIPIKKQITKLKKVKKLNELKILIKKKKIIKIMMRIFLKKWKRSETILKKKMKI